MELSDNEKIKEAEYLIVKNIMDSHPKLDRQVMIGLNYPEWAVDRVLLEKGEPEKDERVKIQEDAQLGNTVLELIAAKKRGQASEKIVQRILKEYHIYTTRDDNNEEVWIYHKGIYVPNGKSMIKEIVRRCLGLAYTTQIYNEVLSKIEADTFIDIDQFFQTRYKNEVAVKNGILNIFTRELSPFNPDKIFFNKLPVVYNPEAQCDLVDSFLKDILADENDRYIYYELGGFALLKEYMFEKAFMFVGNGRNGKGKCLELLKRVIGAENCYALPLSVLSNENADVSGLFNKLINMAGDIGHTDLKDTALFKSLTGRDEVTIKRKYLTALTFQNYAKFVFACNKLPMVYDLSPAFWDRWVLLEFPFYFADKEEFEKADMDKKKNWKLRDEQIISRITTEQELSGLLNAFLEGLNRLMRNRKFSTTKGSEEVKTMWIRKSNSFIAFCMDMIVEDYEGMISKKELRRRYAEYCSKHKLSGVNDFVIKRFLQETYGASEERLGNDFMYSWSGIKWK